MKEAERVANEIIEEYLYLRLPNEKGMIPKGLTILEAKQCALICVERIIDELQLLNRDPHFRTLFSFYQEVKTIIENK